MSETINPVCGYFNECGGCTAQHIPYEVQLKNKKEQLQRATGYENVELFYGEPYGYRNRVDMVFHEGGLGFRKKEKWWKVIDVENCAISNPRINEILKELRVAFRDVDTFDLKKRTGTFRYAVIRAPRLSSSVSFVLNRESFKLDDSVKRVEDFATSSSVDNVIVTYVNSESPASISDEYYVIKGSDLLQEQLLEKRFWFHIQGFFQTNSLMAEKMQGYCRDLISKTDNSHMHLLDLYGGVGTFGILNASSFKTVKIVESVSSCIELARKNITDNNISNGSAEVLDAQYLKRLDLQSPLYVITDPPRSGMHPKTIQNLLERAPERIVYISCNIKQLAADLTKFHGYTVQSAALFDLFPQTPHAEGVVELWRN